MSTRSVARALTFVALAALVVMVLAGCQRPSEPTGPDPAAKTVAAQPSGGGPDVKAITLELLDGRKVALADHVGKDVVVIDFWATWCPPCTEYLPKFAELAERYKDKGAVFYAVSQDDDGAKSVKPFVEKNNVTCNVALDQTHALGKLFGVESIPYTVVIDMAGKVTLKHIGYETGGEEEVARAVDAALAG